MRYTRCAGHAFEGPIQQLYDLVLIFAVFLKRAEKVTKAKDTIKLAVFCVNGSDP